MISKRQKPTTEGVSLRRRLNADISDLIGTNAISIARGVDLSHNAQAAGASADQAVVPERWRWGQRGNLARNYRMWKGRNSQWPKHYWAKIRMVNPKTHKERWFWIAFLLPHEILDTIMRLGRIEKVSEINGADPITRAFIEEMRAKYADPHLVGVGLWGDEVPCFWDRSESVSALTINLPGLSDEYSKMRVPLCAINHAYWGPNTWHDILEVVAWSFLWLDHGRNPATRHDKRPWFDPTNGYLRDKERLDKAGSPLHGRGTLSECRGDWKFFAEAYGMPLWNSGQGICWDCRCTKEEAYNGLRPTQRAIFRSLTIEAPHHGGAS